jgi:4-aminobutyrate aminotransferase/(S)-3-amino-2-methylpropionate transaminase
VNAKGASQPPALRRGDLLPRLVGGGSDAEARRLRRAAARFETPGLAPPAGALMWAAARGANVLDVDGNRFLDFTSGFGAAAVGHRHPRVVAAIRRQAGRLIHGLGDAHGHPGRVALAAALAARSPLPEPRVAFAVSGADAVELALKTALLATGRGTIIAFAPAYHGLTLGALNLASRRHFRRHFTAHLHSRVRRLAYGCAAADLAAALAGDAVAAVVVEPVVGREGVLLPPAGWLAELATLCRRHGTLLIADEILTGCGRTGRWFAVQHDAVVPDLVCCGKALGGGMPVAAVIGRSAVMAAWDAPGEARHTATFVAQPLACAAALATLDVLTGERLPARAAALGRRIADALADWPGRFTAVREVRGRGALWGIEWRSAAAANAFVDRARSRGVLLLAGGADGRVAQLLPPLVITDRQLDHGLAVLAAAGE